MNGVSAAWVGFQRGYGRDVVVLEQMRLVHVVNVVFVQMQNGWPPQKHDGTN